MIRQEGETIAFTPDQIPAARPVVLRPGAKLLALRAVMAAEVLDNGIRPASISATWGVVLNHRPPLMRQRVRTDAVYVAPAWRGQPLPARSGPLFAPFQLNADNAVARDLPQGGQLVALSDSSPMLHKRTHGLSNYPVRDDRVGDTLYVHRLVYAGEHTGALYSGQFDTAEAAVVLDALARAIVPGEQDAAWLTARLLPPPPGPRRTPL